VVEEIEAKGAKVEEGGYQTPVLQQYKLGLWHGQHTRGTHLALEEDGADAVEELEGRDDVALDQHTRTQRRRHPPSCAHGHLEEPLLQREAAHHAVPASKNVCHGTAAAGLARDTD
jgi:hypothetical protein